MLDNEHLIVGGAGAGVEIVERAKPVEGDRDLIFKSALGKSHESPLGQPLVTKASDTDNETIDLAKPDACSKLIRRAHSSGAASWQPFAESQSIAKAASIAAGNGRVVRVFHEGGAVRFEVACE